MHECSLTWCPYNCGGYCYTDCTQPHYQEMACDPRWYYIPTEMQNYAMRRNKGGDF